MRYGLIGAGMMGREHVRNLALLKGASVAALSDPDAGSRGWSAGEVERAFGRAPAVFDDHRRLLEHASLDALVIASPNDTHVPILLDVLDARPDLPVLMEKPVATSFADVATLRTRAAGHRAPLWVAMEYRYMPPVAELARRVACGKAGRLRMLSLREHRFPFLDKVADWNRFNARTGGTLVEKCCHFFDLMRLIVGAEPVRIYASGGADVNHREERHGGRAPDILDHAYTIVDFENGVRAMLELCMFAEGAWFQEEIAAIGDVGKLEALIPGPARFWPGGEERHSEIVWSPRSPKGPVRRAVEVDETVLKAGDHHGATYFQHLRFREAVRNGAPVEVTLADGLRAVEMGLHAEASVLSGQAVALQPAPAEERRAQTA